MAAHKKDIKNEKQIREVILLFYELIKKDRVLKIYFKSFDDQAWQNHLTSMTSFWSNIVLFSEDYEGNPMLTHYSINELKKLTPLAFERWLAVFEQAVTHKFEGKHVDIMLEKAKNIAVILEHHINKKIRTSFS